jgi:hypothetical protein
MKLLLVLVWFTGVYIMVILASTRKGEFRTFYFLINDILEISGVYGFT